jgi:phosphocarrier protein HPr
MKSVKVVLSMAESVKNFVNIVNKYAYDIDLRSGRFLIDAKSLLGIFSLDLSKPIVLEIHSDKCDDLLDELKDYIQK